MRKLKLQMQTTLDGFVAGPQGELDWMKPEMDDRQVELMKQLTLGMDTILMGRKMASGFTNHWEGVVDSQPGSAEYEYAKIFVDTPKIIFSKTVTEVEGKNVTVENGDIVEAVNKLKKQAGKDMIVYGGANFVSSLIEHKLIDELYLFVNPVAIGEGLTIFTGRQEFQLINSVACANSVVVNQYKLFSI
jgi:dihydrofolate reductase